MLLLPHKKVRATVNFYVKAGIPFLYTVNRSNMAVKCKIGSFSSNRNRFEPHELTFIKKVKHNIIENGLHYAALYDSANKDLTRDPVYFAYSKHCRPGKIYPTVYNVDIKSAYWQTAYHLNLIPDSLFKEGNDTYTISKKTRLAAIGSLAKKVSTYEFDGQRQFLKSNSVEDTDFLWNMICSRVGNVLMEVSKHLSKSFIFFWVDGIYLTNFDAAKKAASLFKKYGYESSVQKLHSASVTESYINVRPDAGNKIKPFHYSENRHRI